MWESQNLPDNLNIVLENVSFVQYWVLRKLITRSHSYLMLPLQIITVAIVCLLHEYSVAVEILLLAS
jgi:hypothetical protein